MTVRQGILQRFLLDCLSLKTENGYELNYYKAVSGYVPLNAVSVFPSLSYSLGQETVASTGNDGKRLEKTLKANITAYVDTLKEEGALTEAIEKVYNDINKFVNQDISISRIDDERKVLNLQKVYSKGQYGHAGVSKWNIDETFPVLDIAQGKAEVMFGITIIYTDHSHSLSDYYFDQ